MIDLPSNVIWLDVRLGVAIVQGDRCECVGAHEQGRCMAAWPVMEGEVRYPPQAWAQYDKPCDHCLGARRVMAGQDYEVDCTWCRDGRQVWTVRWPCPTCLGDGYTMGYGQLHRCERCRIERHHDDCDDSCQAKCIEVAMDSDPGYLSARATIQVVPVWESTFGAPHDTLATIEEREAGPWVEVCNIDEYVVTCLWGKDFPGGRSLPLDPLPTPGRDYAVIVRLAETV